MQRVTRPNSIVTFGDFLRENPARVMLGVGPLVISALSIWLMGCTSAMSPGFCNVRTWAWYASDQIATPVGFNESYLHLLILFVVLLIIWNTFAYLIDSLDRTARVAHWLNIVSLLVAAAWLIHVYSGWIEWPYVDDVAAALVFTLFVLVDWRMYRSSRKATTAEPQPNVPKKGAVVDKEAAKLEKKLRKKQQVEVAKFERLAYLLQIWAVDLPVLFGLLCAAIATSFVFHRGPKTGLDPASSAFDVGFHTGTLVMHLAISQFIFYIIYIWCFANILRAYRRNTPPAT